MTHYKFKLYRNGGYNNNTESILPMSPFISNIEDVQLPKNEMKCVHSLPFVEILDERGERKLSAHLFLYYNKNQNLVCHITSISQTNLNNELVSVFLDQLSLSMSKWDVSILRIEIHPQIPRVLTFPFGRHALINPITSKLDEYFSDDGFSCVSVKHTFSLPNTISDLRNNVIEWKKSKKNNSSYWTLWYSSDTLEHPIQSPPGSDLNSPIYSDWELDASINSFSDRSFILFLKSGNGFIHWLPNFYPLIQKYGKKCWYYKPSALQQYVKTMKSGKIFRLMVKDTETREMDIEDLICSAAYKINEFNLNRIEISNVDSNDFTLLSVLHKLNGNCVMTSKLLEKGI